jgi:8-oxo-dGTP diphosphatase
MDIFVIAAVVIAEHRLLLVRKKGTLHFMLPGGKPLPQEGDVACLTREVDEELGAMVRPASVRFLGAFHANSANEPGMRVHAHVYEAALENEPAARGEIEEIRWMPTGMRDGIQLAPLVSGEILPYLAARSRANAASPGRAITP